MPPANKPPQESQDGRPYVAPESQPGPGTPVVMPQTQSQDVTPNGPQQSYTPAGPQNQERTAPDQPYQFITNPPPPPKQSLMSMLPGGNSIAIRAGLLAGGLIVLFILFSIIKGLFGGDSGLSASLISVAQDQQELIHLATNAVDQQGASVANQNAAATIQLSLTSSRSDLIKYLASGHKKIKPKTLNLKVSPSTDAQLQAAVAATTYDQTFQEVMQTKLATYSKDMQKAYKLVKGKKGRALLNDSYNQAQLLQVQLTTPAS